MSELCCFFCPDFRVRTVDKLLLHLQSQCLRRATSEQYRLSWPCGNCTRSYDEKRILKRHLITMHIQDIPPTPARPTALLVSPSSSCMFPSSPYKTPVKGPSAPQQPISPCLTSIQSPRAARRAPTPMPLVDLESYLRDQFAALIASFHSNPGMTEKSVPVFVDSFHSFQQDVLYIALQRILDHFDSTQRSCEHLTQFLNTLKIILEKCCTPLRTIHRRFKHFAAAGTYITPEPVFFSRQNVQKRHGPGQQLVVGQFIPSRLLLARLLSMPGLLEEMSVFVESMRDPEGAVWHFMHSPNWHQMMLKCPQEDGVIWLPIHVYFDEFEAGNPLGSRAGKNKLGAVYFSLPSLPFRFVSKIKFIFLMLSFRASDNGVLRVDDGDGQVVGNSVFGKVVDELNYLREVGVEVQTPSTTVTVKFVTACLLGDNLGLNQICGFVESFSSPHCCRVCTDSYKTAPFVENPDTLRNAQNYERALQLDNVSRTGVKERCIWLGAHGFDLFANTNPDHMHDFLEGACYYVMYEVIKGLKDNLPTFSLANLTTRIKHFAFGPESNAPAEVNIVHEKGGGGRLRKMSANEVRVFVSYFGLLVGDLVPEFDENESTTVYRGRVVEQESPHRAYKYYDLYLRLIKVQELIGCRSVTPAIARALEVAVQRLNSAYMECSGRPHVPPKLHFLIHYSSAMLRNGPILSLSSMTFEKKHKELKRALTSIASTVNTPLSAAKKIMLLVNSFLTANELPPNTFVPGHLKPVPRAIVDPMVEKMGYPSDAVFKETKTVESPTSITYSIGSIISTDFVDEGVGCLPHFFKILKLFHCASVNECVTLAQPFRTLYWSTHFHAYRVKQVYALEAAEWVKLSTLEFPFPNTFCSARDGKDYIFMRNSTAHLTYART